MANAEAIQRAIEEHGEWPGALLPILHAIQADCGYIPAEALDILPSALASTRAEIQGVVSFYDHFRDSPPGASVLRVCRAEACQAVGARQLEAHLQRSLGIDYHQTTADGRVTLEPVYCLGNCACGPSVQVGERVYGRVTTERADLLLRQLAGAGESGE